MLFVIADDHRLMREMLVDTMQRIDGVETEILEVGSYTELFALSEDGRRPDIILLDFNMPGGVGIDGITRAIQCFPDTPVMVISGSIDPAVARRCLDAGADGFIPKTVSSTALRNAVRVVLDGERYIHPFALEPGNENTAVAPTASGASPVASPRLPQWSEREKETLELLIAGKTNKQIARDLKLQEMTVKTHVRNIYRKLGAVNRADAVRMVLQSKKT